MKARGCALVVLLCLLASPAAQAESWREAWRSPFGSARGVAVNPTDGSCWAATGASVMHVSVTGAVVSQTDGLKTPRGISANSADGSCWVADEDAGEVLHLGVDGQVLWRGAGFDHPISVSVNPRDGSCWVACQGTYDQNDPHLYNGSAVVHLAADGTELWRGTDFNGPTDVSVNPNDGSCWVGSTGSYNTLTHQWVGTQPLHLAEDGTRLWEGTGFWGASYVSVNTSDNSCWISDTSNRQLVHVSADGAELWRGDAFMPLVISVNPTDGSLWAFDWDAWAAVHLAADGTELWRSAAKFACCSSDVSVNPVDGSCWVADTGRARVYHLDANGGALFTAAGFTDLGQIIADPTDDSCWVVDYGFGDPVLVNLAANGDELWRLQDGTVPISVAIDEADGSFWLARRASAVPPGQVLHLSRDGVELTRATGFFTPASLAVDPEDRSCWVADYGTPNLDTHVRSNSSVAHLAPDGSELWRGRGYLGAVSLSLNPADRSCWVADSGGDEVVHLSAAGQELWRGGGFSLPDSVGVNPLDGSCWVADDQHHEVVRLSAEGEELWRGTAFGYPHSISVDPRDGTCWVATNGIGAVRHLAVDGTVLWRDFDLIVAGAVSVSPVDGSVWVTDTYNWQVVHLVHSRFPDVPFEHWAYGAIEACAVAGIVSGFPGGTYQPARTVTRDQMAVYISRALAGGDGSVQVPSGVAEPTFSDVGADHWAYRYIEYCAGNDLVQGYTDGSYHPDEAVNRGQMAVYIARAVAGGDDAVPADTDGPTFTDVTGANDWAWCYDYVEYCAAAGIVQGYSDSTYHPENPVTRDQMAVYVARAFGLEM